MAAVPSRGRAARVEGAPAVEADLTRALYERYANQIFRYCLHQLGSREEAEDAVQSTFLNAFRGIKRGVVPEVEAAWLFKIAHNVCLSRRRSSWRRGRIESPADFELVEELAPAPSNRADELIGLQDVLEQMPAQQRRAILLREWQGLSYREIAEELELSQPAVETLIFRARRSLAQGLEQPVAARRRRSRLAAGALGNLLSSAQSFLVGGGAAVKVAATVAVVSAGTVVATAPDQPRHVVRPPAPRHAAARHARAAAAPATTTAAAATAPVAPPAASLPPSTPARPRPRRHAHAPAVGRAPHGHAFQEPAPAAVTGPVAPPREHGPFPTPARRHASHGRAEGGNGGDGGHGHGRPGSTARVPAPADGSAPPDTARAWTGRNRSAAPGQQGRQDAPGQPQQSRGAHGGRQGAGAPAGAQQPYGAAGSSGGGPSGNGRGGQH